MDLPVLDGHGVNSQLLGYEVHGVETVFHLLDLGVFGHSTRAGHCGCQVEGGDACGEIDGVIYGYKTKLKYTIYIFQQTMCLQK